MDWREILFLEGFSAGERKSMRLRDVLVVDSVNSVFDIGRVGPMLKKMGAPDDVKALGYLSYL